MLRRPHLPSSCRALFIVLLSLAFFTVGCGDDSTNSDNTTDTGASSGADTSAEDMASSSGMDTQTSPDTIAPTPDATDVTDVVEIEQIEIPPEPWDITTAGPYNVGFRLDRVTYDAVGEEGRSLRIAAWYPTQDATGEGGMYISLLRREEVLFYSSISEHKETFPVLVFSHGNAALAEQSYFMAERFASHGWIVISPDHTNNTFADTEGSINFGSAPFRPQDISAVLDHFLDLPPEHILAGRLDEANIAMSGHSFGAFTTILSAGTGFDVDGLAADCAAGLIGSRQCGVLEAPEAAALFREGFYDDRIRAFIPQTPGGSFAFRDTLDQITSPLLMFTGGLDASLSNEEEGDPIWAGMVGDNKIRIDITNAGHFTFSNMCDLFPFIPMVFEDGCDPEIFIDPPVAYDIINHYSMAFFRRHLFEDHSYDALLDGTEQPYAEHLTLSTKPSAP